MNPIYEQALAGTLKSHPGQSLGNVEVTNNTEVNVLLFQITNTGTRLPAFAELAPKQTATVGPTFDGDYDMVTAAATGAFAMVISYKAGISKYVIDCSQICSTNDIGPLPQPNKDKVIPTDSPLVMVGCGVTPAGNPLLRQQYWSRQSDSYVLAPEQSDTVSFTVKSGTQSTTTSQEQIAESVGVSASAGWGPISASVSASLSKSSSHTQQVSVTSETTRYQSTTISNNTKDPQMYMKWQLTDVVTIFDKKHIPVASIENAEPPVLIAGPYNPTSLPGSAIADSATEPVTVEARSSQAT